VKLRTFELDGITQVEVTLSRRNLRALIAKLGDSDSKRTIVRDEDNGMRLIVCSEPDDEHYGERPPGMMAPWTEAQMLLDGFES
jgi:hypothetical protein